MAEIDAFADDSVCPGAEDGQHQWKFNGGNVVCLSCREYRHKERRIVLPASIHEDGTVTVHPPAQIDGPGADDLAALAAERDAARERLEAAIVRAWQQGRPVAQIARLAGCSRNAVYELLDRRGAR